MYFLPKNSHYFLHVRLSNLKSILSLSYRDISFKILEDIIKLNPKSIIVPTYSYQFTSNYKFDLKKTKSQIGRFSEEIRTNFPSKLRFKDPIFSFLDVLNYGWVKKEINLESYGTKSIFHKLYLSNGTIVNIDLDHIVSTQIMYSEYRENILYKQNKIFKGIFNDGNKKKKINYNFFCKKDKKDKKIVNRKKLEFDLLKDKVMLVNSWNNVGIRWFKVREFTNYLRNKLKKNKNYLII